MHRDSIEPGIASDISTISPTGGSIGKTSTERLVGTSLRDLGELRSLVNDLRKRVKQLEAGQVKTVVPEPDYTELIRNLDRKYLIKNGSAQTISSNVTFEGAVSISGQVTITGPFGLAYGWAIVCGQNDIWTYKNSNPAGQLS
jgi:hypothetical protein